MLEHQVIDIHNIDWILIASGSLYKRGARDAYN